MIHILIFAFALWVPSQLDTDKEYGDKKKDSLGNEYIDIRVTSALRITNWELRNKIENKNDDGFDISTTRYDMNDSLMREYSLLFNTLGVNAGLVYGKNEARKENGKLEYSAAESFMGYIGVDDLFSNGGKLIAKYRSEAVSGLTIITDWSGQSLEPVAFEGSYKHFMLAEEFSNGVYIGVSHNIHKTPSGVAFLENSGGIKPFLDENLTIKSTKFIMGGSSTNLALERTRYYRGVYHTIEVGLGLFDYEYSDDLKAQVASRNSFTPSGGHGLVFGGKYEVGFAIHKRFQGAYDLGMAIELGISLEADKFMSSELIPSEEEGKGADIQFERTDFRYGPIVRLTAVF